MDKVQPVYVSHGGGNMDLYTAPEYSFDSDTYRMQIATGSTLCPTNPIRSCAEKHSELVKAVGGLQEAVGLSIGPNYRSTCHLAAIDLEKVSGATPAGGEATFTGISTKNSGEIRIVYEDLSAHRVTSGDAEEQFNYYPSQMYICLSYDTTLVQKRSGVLFAD